MDTRIIVADDHPVVREGVRALLERETNFQVVAETGDGLETVRLVRRIKPDILITDLIMPGLNGLEVVRQVGRRSPQTRVIVLSGYDQESFVLEALRHGAAGYVLKGRNITHILEAVHCVMSGRQYLSPPLSEHHLSTRIKNLRDAEQDPYDSLTTREREVIQFAAQGYTSVAMADCLFLSPRTVEIHRANAMKKLNLRTHTDLIRYAIKRGIIPLDFSIKTSD